MRAAAGGFVVAPGMSWGLAVNLTGTEPSIILWLGLSNGLPKPNAIRLCFEGLCQTLSGK